ncbi:MAG: endolytic transglycosylase MltG [Rhodocyclaceae bacterium]|nr:endolytic transglycosylase MltG [Rhodocyclaceae bacterium]
MGLVKRLLLVAVLVLAGFSGWVANFALSPVSLAASPLEFAVRPGSGLRAAAGQMADAGIGFAPWQFSLLGRITGRATTIKAGSYEVETGVTPWQLLAKLTKGDVSQAEILFVEGWTFAQVRRALDAHPDLGHETRGLADREVLVRLGIAEENPEGLFFPDTYLFAKQSADLQVLARAYRSLSQKLAAEWDARAPGLPYTRPYQALIMASIVEKETGRAEDRGRIAAVFVNRLRRGMLLQTDPAVIYGLGARFDGNLRKRDLLTDGPYNTYTRAGLPPTPIAMPGLASLQAALRPAKADDLYFVARGDGSSQFSRTLDEHNRAVDRYQRR